VTPLPTTLVLEPIGGAAGDMTLAALLHLGEALGRQGGLRAALESGLAALAEAAGPFAVDLAGVQVETTEVFVSGIRSLHVEVVVPAAARASDSHHRPWKTIRALLTEARLPERARALALATFERLARAEGQVHGLPADDVEFHEVGSVDAIVDITGVALLIDALAEACGVAAVLALPPPAGGGLGRSAHGEIPLPAPATLQVLAGRSLRPSGPGERTTPTGAALLAALTLEADALPALPLVAIGYGAGTRRWADAPNLMRASLYRGVPRGEAGDGPLWQMETNLDDLTPQLLSVALAALLEAGAKDAWLCPVVMKKGRPGHLLAALVAEPQVAAVEAAFFRETPTLGVRRVRAERTTLERRFVEAETPWGKVRVKLGLAAGRVSSATPEFEDCAALARQHGVAVREVVAAAAAAWRAQASPTWTEEVL
jgi:uncharacterized protein (TIGR00299 family) protein